MGIYFKFWLTLPRPLTKYGQVMWLKLQILKSFNFSLILHEMLGKVTRIQVLKFATSEVISKNNFNGGGKHPLPVRLGLNLN